jgi:hypothetical protein
VGVEYVRLIGIEGEGWILIGIEGGGRELEIGRVGYLLRLEKE